MLLLLSSSLLSLSLLMHPIVAGVSASGVQVITMLQFYSGFFCFSMFWKVDGGRICFGPCLFHTHIITSGQCLLSTY